MSTFTAVYDACVLYPAPLRDFLMYLAVTDLFRARWSDAIHHEWMENLLRNRPDLKREQLERTRAFMDRAVRDCLVTGHEPLIDSLSLPDPNDRHVFAAAIRAQADVIVTYNLKDFPVTTLSGFGIEAQHPDEFTNHLLDLSPEAVCAAAKQNRGRLKNPPKTVDEYLDALSKQQLTKTAARLRDFAELI